MKDWAIFCRVVDNYGDIGVCWRLARQLAAEFGLNVTLWVDDLASFARIRPEIVPQLDTQTLEGVQVHHWPAELSPAQAGSAAAVVIEAFACELPAAYLAAMRARPTPPVWLNLEYLSAEDWVAGCHGLPSPQQGMAKYFFFPGFTAQTGGLPSEAQQRSAQAAWNDTAARRWLAPYVGAQALPDDALLVSLFAYEPAALNPWLASLITAPQATVLLVPEGRVSVAIDYQGLGLEQHPDGVYRQGQLWLCPLPMLSQDDYDRLLWSCDVNFVRGEDSFVRAQWAAKPLIWHIYPQDEGAHLEKLAAFLALYLAQLPPAARAAVQGMMDGWNTNGDLATAWGAYRAQYPTLAEHARQWQQSLRQLGDLATNLVRFVESKVK